MPSSQKRHPRSFQRERTLAMVYIRARVSMEACTTEELSENGNKKLRFVAYFENKLVAQL